MAYLSKREQTRRLIEKLHARVEEAAEVRECAAAIIEALKLDPPKKMKALKAMDALEKKLISTSRCGCGRHASYRAGLRGGMCETCMST